MASFFYIQSHQQQESFESCLKTLVLEKNSNFYLIDFLIIKKDQKITSLI